MSGRTAEKNDSKGATWKVFSANNSSLKNFQGSTPSLSITKFHRSGTELSHVFKAKIVPKAGDMLITFIIRERYFRFST